MKHDRQTPNGVTGPYQAQHERAMRNDGWRKPTQALGRAEHLAAAGEARAASRTRCVVAIKRVGAHIGLKAADLLLLDTLSAFTQPQDWEAGRRPIVWASNAYLMERTGFSLSTLKRHARQLVEVGAITFRDSPNGKRWGHRDADGVIVEAYGFDLSPLSARVEAYEAMAEALAAEYALCQRLRRQITVARRSIRARLEAGQAGRALREAFEALLARLPGVRAASDVLSELLEHFLALLTRARAEMSEAEESEKMNPREVISDPHIQITNELESVSCNSSEDEKVADAPPRPDENVSGKPMRVGVDIPTILQACPEFTTWARQLGGYVRNWSDLVRVASDLRPMIGVSEQAWTRAQAQMGKAGAAAALALIFDKVHAGTVTSPGGYLRGMADKAGAGELHLERSFFGRLGARAG